MQVDKGFEVLASGGVFVRLGRSKCSVRQDEVHGLAERLDSGEEFWIVEFVEGSVDLVAAGFRLGELSEDFFFEKAAEGVAQGIAGLLEKFCERGLFIGIGCLFGEGTGNPLSGDDAFVEKGGDMFAGLAGDSKRLGPIALLAGIKRQVTGRTNDRDHLIRDGVTVDDTIIPPHVALERPLPFLPLGGEFFTFRETDGTVKEDFLTIGLFAFDGEAAAIFNGLECFGQPHESGVVAVIVNADIDRHVLDIPGGVETRGPSHYSETRGDSVAAITRGSHFC